MKVMGVRSRNIIPINLLPSLFTLFFIIVLRGCCAALYNYTITPTQYITDSQTLVSLPDKIFRLGFFKLGNSTNRYVGIWYNNIPGPTIVWVANRDKPINDSTGVLRIANDGNLVVLDGRGNLLWTTNVSNIAYSNLIAELLDSGNLVLRERNDNTKGGILWQSFDHPSDTLLPMMEFGVNLRTGEKQVLTSWRDTNSDPSTGSFTLELDPFGDARIFIKNGSDQLHWQSSRPFRNNDYFNDNPRPFHLYKDNTKGAVYLALNYKENSVLSRFVLDSDGKLVERKWDEEKKTWYEGWFSPFSECDIYSKCGPFGSCDMLDSPICSCLRGFEPKFKEEWRNGNWSSGCVRRTELQCERNNKTNNIRGGKEADGFLILENVKVPDYDNWRDYGYRRDYGYEECEQKCLIDCSCTAYSYTNSRCMWWTGDVINIQKLRPRYYGKDLHIRVAYSEIDKKGTIKIIVLIIGIVLAISIGIYFCWRWVAKQRHFWRWMAKQRGSIYDYYLYLIAMIGRMKRGMRKSVQREKRRRERKKKKKDMRVSLFDMNDGYGEPSDSDILITDNPELKIFSFENLDAATNNFSEANKLGHGGFGSVYKGKLLDGQEIAVKRLAKNSGQGLREFKNEVLVISKLQHRNLVRLLGCSVQEDEKILIYEYMPNKSLDAFLFDETRRAILDWRKRFLIIEGISRGVLYLHRDSRLRVIHRDLKASNILLDKDLNPKISDFGMARTFGGDELQANTRRVAGTFGYMPPEYVIEGRFSEKSDVFSFGVLLLEIVSGKKNASLFHEELSLRLLGYAWKLWNENRMKMLIDPILLSEPSFEQEIIRCIHVGLLCVQEFEEDRPTMSTTLSMLTSEITSLPIPKHPAFTERRVYSESSSSQKKRIHSINNVTNTSIGGR